MLQRRAWIFFWLYVGAIVYLSLYPGAFLLHAKAPGLFWAPLDTRRIFFDTWLNVLFYVPLGGALFLALGRSRLAAIAAGVAGAGLSWFVEWIQLWTPNRYGTYNDLCANSAGAVLGSVLVWWLERSGLLSRYSNRESPFRIQNATAVLLVQWFCWHTFPFIPRTSLYDLRQQLETMTRFSWGDAVQASLGFAVLRLAAGKSPWIPIALAVFPAQLVLTNQRPSLAAFAGAAIGWFCAARIKSAGRGLAAALTVWLFVNEFRPFTFTGQFIPFEWRPFGSWYEVASESYYPIVFAKLYLYTATVWAFRMSGLGWWIAAGVPFTILSAGEWAQQFLPGRTPESTDLALLLAGAGLLRWAGLQTNEFAVQRHEYEVERAQ